MENKIDIETLRLFSRFIDKEETLKKIKEQKEQLEKVEDIINKL